VVQLDGSGSSAAGEASLTYLWSLISKPEGSTASIKDSTSAQASFSGDLLGDYQFQLVVNDGEKSSTPAQAKVTLTNAAPIASAGADQKVNVDTTVTLSGSGTDSDGQVLTYSWALTSKPEASAAELSAQNVAKPTFQVDLPGEYVFSLSVNDSFVDSSPDTVTITTNNVAPLANAGANIGGKFVGDTVMLDGSKSTDLDGDSLTYAWSLVAPEGSSAQLSSSSAVMPTFTVDVRGIYEATLIVNDGTAPSAPATVKITADGNTAPEANAGADQSVLAGTLVTLKGTASDVDGDDLSLTWALTDKPDDSAATLDSTDSASTTFTPDIAGNYTIQFQVSDGELESADSVSVTATSAPVNNPPVAEAGPDQSFTNAATVMLDGGQSADSDGDTFTYLWSFASKPSGSSATLSGADTQEPSFTLDEEGTYVIQLIVNDGELASAPDTVTISYLTNVRPVALIEAESEWTLGEIISLDGLGSNDADGDVLTYQWSVTEKPAASKASFDNDTDPQPQLTVDTAGEYRVQLIVNDGLLDSKPELVTLIVTGVAPDKDSDGDGLPDALELQLGLDPNDPDTGSTGIPDGLKDHDEDGLPNIWEVRMGYDPAKADSNGDGVTDGGEDFDGDGVTNRTEIAWGSDPREAANGAATFTLVESPVVVGERIQYIIHVANRRTNETITGATVKLTVPEGVSFHYATDAAPNASCGNASTCRVGHEASWNLGSLAPGENRTIQVNGTVAASVTPGTLIETPVTVTATNAPDPINLSRSAIVVDSQPVFFTLTPSKDPVQPGESFSLELDLGNSTNAAVTGNDIRLVLPAGLSVTDISHDGTQTGNTVSWSVASLAPTASLKRSVQVTLAEDAVLASTLTAVAQLRHSGGLELDRELHADISVSNPLPLQVSYILMDAPVSAGGRLRYDITISNTNVVGIVNNVSAMLRVPAGVTIHYATDAAPNVSCGNASTCSAGHEASWDLGNLAPGESRTIQANATVAASVSPGTLLQTPLTVTATELGDTVRLVRSAAVVQSQPVFFTLTPSKDPVQPGESFNLELDLGNSTNAPVTGSDIRLVLPAGLSVTDISHDGTQTGNTVSWSVASLAPTASLKRRVQVTLAEDAVLASTLTAVAQLRHSGGLELDRELHADISVSDPLPLQVSYTLLDAPVSAGGRLRYDITISNTNVVGIVNNVSAMLRVPAGVAIHYATDAAPNVSCGNASTCGAGHEASWDLGNLAPGQSRTIQVNATVAASVSPGTLLQTPLTVTATELGDTVRLVRSAAVVQSQPVFFTLTPSKDPVQPGESFNLELDLGNSTNAPVTGSDIRLVLPAGLSVTDISHDGTQTGNTVSWSVASLAPTASLKRRVQVTLAEDAVLASTLTAVAQLRHSGGLELDRELHADISVSDPLPLQVSYTLLDAPVSAGGRLRYDITISNTNVVGIVNNVSAMLRVPAGVAIHYATDAAPNVSCGNASTCSAGHEASWDLGNLAPGESRTIQANATVAASVSPGTLLQTPLTVTATELGDTVRLVRSAAVVQSQPVFFTLTPSKDAVQPGESFSLMLDLGNSTDDSLSDAEVEVILPEGLEVESASHDGDQDGNVISWSIDSLAAETALMRSIQVAVTDDMILGRTLTVQAQLRHNGGLELDRELHANTSVTAALPLAVNYSLAEATVSPGGELRYTITVSNTNVVGIVNDVFAMLRVPAGVSFHYSTGANPNASCGNASTCSAGHEASWNVGDLAPGESATIEVNATVAASVTPGTLIQTPLTVTAEGLDDTVVTSRTAAVGSP
jgi:uncharacterized repeat protein (TIGR01451 family)